MIRKISVFLLLLCSLGFVFSVLFAEDNPATIPTQKTIEKVINPPIAEKENIKESEFEIPEWLKRTSYGVVIESDQHPRIYLETVQPLYQSLDKIDTCFTHGRISIQNERGTYSLGLGYRRLLYDENLLAGINTFFDYQDLHQHYRQGLGLELISKRLELRTNAYFALSGRRLVEEDASSFIYERAVNGGDVEIGGPVPYLPWLKIFANYYQYDFKKFNNMKGWKLRGELKPFKFITLNLETYDDNKGEREYRMDGRLTLMFDDFTPRSILSAFNFSQKPYPDVDLKERNLDRVERNFNIQVEKWSETKTGGFALQIGRGT
jgi:hypothetical protein